MISLRTPTGDAGLFRKKKKAISRELVMSALEIASHRTLFTAVIPNPNVNKRKVLKRTSIVTNRKEINGRRNSPVTRVVISPLGPHLFWTFSHSGEAR